MRSQRRRATPSSSRSPSACAGTRCSSQSGAPRRAPTSTARGRSRSPSGNEEGIAFADQLLGDLALAEGDPDTAGELLVRARDRFRRFRVTLDAGYTLIDLARVRLVQQRFGEALAVAGEALADFRRREDPRGVAGALNLLGQAYTGLGQPERACSALDEARTLAERWGVALWASGQSDEPGEEAALGAGVEPLADERTVALPAVVGEQGDGHVRVAEELG